MEAWPLVAPLQVEDKTVPEASRAAAPDPSAVHDEVPSSAARAADCDAADELAAAIECLCTSTQPAAEQYAELEALQRTGRRPAQDPCTEAEHLASEFGSSGARRTSSRAENCPDRGGHQVQGAKQAPPLAKTELRTALHGRKKTTCCPRGVHGTGALEDLRVLGTRFSPAAASDRAPSSRNRWAQTFQCPPRRHGRRADSPADMQLSTSRSVLQ